MALEDFKLRGQAVLDDKPFVEGLGKMKNESNNFTGGFNKSMLGTVVGIGAAAKGIQLLAASLKTAVADFAYLDKGIAKVNTLMDTSVKSTMQLRTELFEVSRVTGVWAGDLAEASYQALSAGIATKDLTGFIEQMGIVSKAGFTDMNTAVTATTQIMNAYGKETYTVQEITDKMLTSQNNGVTTFDALGKSLYNVIPAAAAMGISLDEVLAGISTLTLSGTPTAQATTQIRQAILELSDDTTKAGKAFKNITGESFRDFINRGGDVATAFGALTKGAENSDMSVNQLFSSVEAGQAALSLGKDGAKEFTKQLDAMGTSAGTTEKAHAKAVENISDKWTELKNKMRVDYTETVANNSNMIIDSLKLLDWFYGKAKIGASTFFDWLIKQQERVLGGGILGDSKFTQETLAKLGEDNAKRNAISNQNELDSQLVPNYNVGTQKEKPTLSTSGSVTGGETASVKAKKTANDEMRALRETERLAREAEQKAYLEFRTNQSISESEFDEADYIRQAEFLERKKILRDNFFLSGTALQLVEEEEKYLREMERLSFQELQLQSDLEFYARSQEYAAEHAETMAAIEENRLSRAELQYNREEQLNQNLINAKRNLASKGEQIAINSLAKLVNINDLSFKEMLRAAKDAIAQALGQEGATLMVKGTSNIVKGTMLMANPGGQAAGAAMIATGKKGLATGTAMLAGGMAVGAIGGGSDSASESGGSSYESTNNGNQQSELLSNEKSNKELTIYTDGDIKDVFLSLLSTLDTAAKDGYNVNLIERGR